MLIVNSVCSDYKKTTNILFPTIIGFVFLFLFSFGVLSQEHQHAPASDNYDKDKALAFSQAAIGREVGNYQFRNTDNEIVDITEYRGKPLIISLIYTSCHHICPTLTTNLAQVVKIAKQALDDDSFSVVSIGFDTAVDSPERMRLYAKERNLDLANWDFLSTDEDTIKAFADEVGFIFFESSKGFDHLSQVTLLDGKGVVYRQIYGVKYEPPMLVEPLKELVFGKHTEATLVEGWINNVRLFCTIYDPLSGRYEFDYSIFIGIFMGIFILGAIAAFIIREWRKNNIKGKT